MPRLNGRRTTCAPCAAATSAVLSTEPSETTTTSRSASKARSSSRTRPMARSSFSAGTIAIRRSAPSSGDTRLLAQAEERQQAARPVAVRVLVEHALARAPSQRVGLRGVGEQVAVGVDRLPGVVHDEQLRAGLEPALD